MIVSSLGFPCVLLLYGVKSVRVYCAYLVALLSFSVGVVSVFGVCSLGCVFVVVSGLGLAVFCFFYG